MKAFLILSLIFNGILGAWVWRHSWPDDRRRSQADIALENAGTRSPAITEQSPKCQPSNSASGLDWGKIESPDYHAYIANLRAVHCPEETIRDIIVADVRKLMAVKTRDIIGSRPKPDEANSLREWQMETLDELLGPAWRESGASDYLELTTDERLGYLDRSKQCSVRRIEERYEILTSELMAKTGLSLTPEEKGLLGDLERRKDAELEEIMAPGEYVHYVREHDPEAASMEVEQFRYKDDLEFLAILQLRKGLTTAASIEGGGQAATDQTPRIRELLGDDRFRQYCRSQNPDYRDLRRIGTDLGLDLRVTERVQDLTDEVLQQIRSVGDDPEAIDAAPDKESAESEVRRLLGPQGFELWRNSGLGWPHFRLQQGTPATGAASAEE